MRKLNFPNSENITSSRVLSYMLFFAVAIVITAVLSLKYYVNQQLFENGISDKDIIAPKTIEVIDIQRTDFRRDEAAKKVRPVMASIEDGYIKNNLKTLGENIKKIKDDESLSAETKILELSNLLEIQDTQRKSDLIDYILDASDANLENTFIITAKALDKLLEIGISENIIQRNEADFITNAAGKDISKSQLKPVVAILEHIIVTNLVVDRHATETARKNARDAVRPSIVIFKKGDNILRVGEPVTQLKQAALEKMGYNFFKLNRGQIIGTFLITCFICSILIFYVRNYERQLLTKRHLSILAVLSIIITICAALTSASGPTVFFMTPIPAYTILVAIFTSTNIAFFATILFLTLFSLTLGIDPIVIATFIFSTLMAVYSVSRIDYSKRIGLIKCGVEIGIMAFCATILITLFERQLEMFSDFETFKNAFLMFINCFISGMIALAALPIFENLFKVITPYALIEFADFNSQPLSILQDKAIGTYDHSLRVANLCEAAAEAIGANPILARVGALYHDIGKLKRPLFFIENQSYLGIENPHTKLNPMLSKMVIISHIKDGVELAQEYGLTAAIIDFIQQHHGDGLAGHFYNQAVAQEGIENVDIEQFRYPGPRPQTKEIAILMLADAAESAVRSLKNPAQEDIENMINKIITERLNDGQLSDSPLTLKDIKLIATTFNRILRGMHHDRIKYHENMLNELENKNKIRIETKGDDANA